MSALALRALPWVLAVGAMLGALLWIDQRGYRRAQAAAERERIVTALVLTRAARASEARLAARIDAIERTRADRSARLATYHDRVVRPALVREITHEARFADPAAGLSDGLREALNDALGAVACTARPGGGIGCALSPAAAHPRQ